MSRYNYPLSIVPHPVESAERPIERAERPIERGEWSIERAEWPIDRSQRSQGNLIADSAEWDAKWLHPILTPKPSPENHSAERPDTSIFARTISAEWREISVSPRTTSVERRETPISARMTPVESRNTSISDRVTTAAERRDTPISSRVKPAERRNTPISTRPAEPEPAMEAEQPELSLTLRFLRWLFPNVNQRRAKRYTTPGLVAYYWTGGAPYSYHVGDMSATGLFLLTKERWAPGTLIQMTLQKQDGRAGAENSITVLSEVVRWGEDGAGFNFVLSDYEDVREYGVPVGSATERKTVERFMRKIGVPQ